MLSESRYMFSLVYFASVFGELSSKRGKPKLPMAAIFHPVCTEYNDVFAINFFTVPHLPTRPVDQSKQNTFWPSSNIFYMNALPRSSVFTHPKSAHLHSTKTESRNTFDCVRLLGSL